MGLVQDNGQNVFGCSKNGPQEFLVKENGQCCKLPLRILGTQHIAHHTVMQTPQSVVIHVLLQSTAPAGGALVAPPCSRPVVGGDTVKE